MFLRFDDSASPAAKADSHLAISAIAARRRGSADGEMSKRMIPK